MNTINQIRENTFKTALCVGLDPDLGKIPTRITRGSAEATIYAFLTAVVDITAPHCALYKVQKAMFDVYPGGHTLLHCVIKFVHDNYPHLPVLLDCKIGDIDNTMSAYIQNVFHELNADGVLVNPLMGDDVLEPLMKLKDKAVIVLCKTSNIGGAIVQDAIMGDGRPLWEYLLDLTVNRWNSNGNMIPVVSSTAGLDMANVRRLIPDEMPILLAGVGAQGGSYNDLGLLLNSARSNVFVNSSRGILYPYQPDDPKWTMLIQAAAIELKNALNAQRGA